MTATDEGLREAIHEECGHGWRGHGALGVSQGCYAKGCPCREPRPDWVADEPPPLANPVAPLDVALMEVGRVAVGVANDWMGDPDHGFILDPLAAPVDAYRDVLRAAAHPDTAGEPGELDETGHRPYCPAGFVRPEPCTCGPATEPPGPLPYGG